MKFIYKSFELITKKFQIVIDYSKKIGYREGLYLIGYRNHLTNKLASYEALKEMSEELVKENPLLTLVRGHYHCPVWGEQQHWWPKDSDGVIHDPTKLQFPSKGTGEYIEFDGRITCDVCENIINEDEAYFYGNHVYCSGDCCYRDVM